MSSIRQKIEANWERIRELEARNKLLEQVLEAAEEYYEKDDQWCCEPYYTNLQNAIRTARGGDEKEG